MLGIILVGFFCFLVALILLVLLFCMVSCCCNNRRNTNADVELGLKKANTNTNLNRIEKSKEYKRISEPVIKDYKLYGQAEMDYCKIKERLQRTGTLFVDDQFPADKYSISYNGKIDGMDVDEIVDGWMRARELYSDPEFIKEGVTKDDVNQGFLGDCWMLAAMAGLSEKKALFRMVVPMGQTFKAGYTGMFLFRFWRYGQWVEVVVDDYVPVKNKKPVFVHSKQTGELWPVLMEKAYSKLQGSYDHLNGGLPMSSMVDFTGGFPQRFYGRNLIDYETLFSDLQEVFENSGMGSDGLVCAGTPSGRLRVANGLIDDHVYTVFGVLESEAASGRPRLLKVRNPWGNGEWRGEWGKDWIKKNRRESMLLRTGPGEFLIKMEDFSRYFDILTICHILGPKYCEKQRRSEITPDCGKVEFSLRLTEDSDTMVAFSQIGRRQLRDEMGSEQTLLRIKFSVYSSNIKISGQEFQALRTRTFRKVLKAGSYKIIAEAQEVDRTTGVFLRVASTCKTFTLS